MKFMRTTATTILALAFAQIAHSAAESPPPNILLFMADDTTFTDFGCYGNPIVNTPNVDRLAREGLRFEHCYNSSPMCAPTRMSLYSGIHPVRNGAWPNHSRSYDHIKSIPHYLGDRGYRVALIGKRHEAPLSCFPFEDLGGRHHDDGDGIDLHLEKVRAFMEESKDRPWCLVVCSNQAHEPWNRGDPSAYDPAKLQIPPYMVDTPETRDALTRYYAEITYMDAQLGKCLGFLDETGQRDNTLVLFLSEHGSSFPFCKWTCYETGLHSAAIARWPGKITAGSETGAIIQYVDILPTMIEAVGGDPGAVGEPFDGRSFLPVLAGKSNKHQPYAFGLQTSAGTAHGPNQSYGIRTVRDERFRYIWNTDWQNSFRASVTEKKPAFRSWMAKAEAGDSKAKARIDAYRDRPEVELYDMTADPWELKNLAGDPAHAADEQRLRAALTQWMKEQGDQGAKTEAAAPSREAKDQPWYTQRPVDSD
jgi:N-sulfoglucosamine sulfohydrolase